MTGGPAGLLIGFGIVGALLWAVMQSLGEMASYLAVSGESICSFRELLLTTIQARLPTMLVDSSIQRSALVWAGTMFSCGLASSVS